MDVLLVVAFIVLAICLIFKWQYSYWTRRGVDSVAPLPIFGNISECYFMQKHISDTIDEIYCQFPDCKYVGAYKFHYPLLVLKDLKLIKRVYSGDLKENYGNPSFKNENLFMNVRSGLHSKIWNMQKTREVLLKHFNEEQFYNNYAKIERITENLVEFIKGAPESLIEDGFDGKLLSSKYTIEAICTALDLEADCFTSPQSDLLSIYRKYFGQTSFFQLIKPDSKRLRKKLTEEINNLPMDKGQNWFIDTLMSVECQGNTLLLLLILYDIFESSNVLLAYSLYEIALNKDLQAQLRNEIKEMSDIDQVCQFSNKKLQQNSSLITNVLFETLRLHSHAFILQKKCINSHKMDGQTSNKKDIIIQKDCQILIPLYSLHLDAKLFQNPFRFDPNRYDGSTDNNNYPYLNLCENSEYCLDFKYGFLQAKLALEKIILNFEVSLTSKNAGIPKFSKQTPYLYSEEGIWLEFNKHPS